MYTVILLLFINCLFLYYLIAHSTINLFNICLILFSLKCTVLCSNDGDASFLWKNEWIEEVCELALGGRYNKDFYRERVMTPRGSV